MATPKDIEQAIADLPADVDAKRLVTSMDQEVDRAFRIIVKSAAIFCQVKAAPHSANKQAFLQARLDARITQVADKLNDTQEVSPECRALVREVFQAILDKTQQ